MKKLPARLFIVLVLVFAFAPTSAAGGNPPVLTATEKAREARLIAHLEKEFPGYAAKIVADPRFTFDPRIIARSKLPPARPSRTRKPKNNFDYVVGAWARLNGIKFIREHEHVLARARAQFGVGKGDIAGIFDAESSFGAGSTGDYRVIQSLNTIFVFMPRFQESKNDPRQGAWSEEQLDAFMRTCIRDHRDPFAQFGSWTGAEGLVQFEPISYEAFAMHYNGKECVSGKTSPVPPDLSGFDDSICSVAHYLRARWGRSNAERMRALLSYNHNRYYGAAILDAADYFSGKRLPHPRYVPTAKRSR